MTSTRGVAFLALLTFAAGTAYPQAPDDACLVTGPKPPAWAAPDFTLPGLDGQDVSLADFRGEPVLLVFWAPSCAPCRVELPLVARMQKELAARNLVVLAVAVDPPEKVRAYLDRTKIDLQSLVDPEHDVGQLYGNCGLPHAFLIDPNGVIRKGFDGPLQETELRKAIADLGPAQTPAASQTPAQEPQP